MTEKASNVLKRYTSLSVAIDTLMNERLTLLSPFTWKDRNYVAFMEGYCGASGLGGVLAACFTQAPETYHHWGVFAGSNEGVRLDFDKSALLDSLKGDDRYVWGDVSYLTLKQIATRNLAAKELPFLKRYAFKDEQEFRLLYRSRDPAPPFHHIPIKRSWVKSITLSPWLAENLIDPVKQALRALPGCASVRLQRTNLRDHAEWKKAIERITS
jgi:hypothetical protein